MRVYIAGKMSGLPDFNYPAFHAKAASLRAAGFEVENPAEHFDGDTTLPYETYIKAALASLLTCEGIVLLSGWRRSHGARLEAYVARETGIVVVEQEDEPEWPHGDHCWEDNVLVCGWPGQHRKEVPA